MFHPSSSFTGKLCLQAAFSMRTSLPVDPAAPPNFQKQTTRPAAAEEPKRSATLIQRNFSGENTCNAARLWFYLSAGMWMLIAAWDGALC